MLSAGSILFFARLREPSFWFIIVKEIKACFGKIHEYKN
jgi:hypothetical protein